ncbi:sensor histidine kinase [Sphingomonas sp. ac-8]|uniref:sensor histidine kinase n=1 Tax=Sphingomonas sp. ac-8 TaxID=3242977 RepID=UPI003A80DA37
MGSSRTRHREGAAAVLAAAGMVASGGAGVWAAGRGFWGTLTVATFVTLWLVVLLWWAVARPRILPAAAPASDDPEGERILLRVLIDQAPGALLAVEEGARVRALNRAARRLFDTDDRVLPAPPALLADDAQRLRHGGRSWRIDRVAVRDAYGARTLVALVDVEPEEHAAEARATRELLRVLGHEVMNALAPIASLAESALAVLDRPERRDRLLPEILGTLARRTDGLRRFTEAYRQVARLPEPTLEPVAIADLFADLARLFEGEWQGRATLALAPPPEALVALDRDQIVQALLALLRNGAEAAAAVGTSPTVGLSAAIEVGRLSFHVRDDGPGVDPVHRASIFLPFFTTKPDGNGIGLAGARQIAQSHGGDVTLRSSAPTIFELTVPV